MAAKTASGTVSESATEALVLEFAASQPEFGQSRVAESLRQRGVRISPSGVRAIWKRHQLETLYKRVSAIEKSGRRDHAVLTETQDARFKRAKRRSQLLKNAERGGKDSNTLRYQLLAIAAQAFGRHGYKGATLKEIAEAAGILPGSIYHYFQSKQDLFSQVHHEGFRELNAAVDQATARLKDPRARLVAACEAHIALLVSKNAIAGYTGNSLFTPGIRVPPRWLIKDRDAYEARFAAMLDALHIPPHLDRSLFRLALFGALNWTQVWYRPGKSSPAEIAHHLVEVFFRQA
jgi:TetR/AcrR family transcriptional regulator, cholesterol catabolism regulator